MLSSSKTLTDGKKSRHKNNITDEPLYQLTTLVAGDFSLQEVLDKLAEAAVRIAGVKACSIRLLDDETGELRMRSTYGLSEQYRNKGDVSREDPVIKASFEGEAVVIDDMRGDSRISYHEATNREGLVSQLTVAMQFRGEIVGVLRLYSPKVKRFDESDITLARAVASQCAAAIINAKLYSEAIEREHIAEQMKLAGVVQRRMIPDKAPLVAGLDMSAIYIPCFDVGGDFYDFLKINDYCIAVAIADVIGKGIPAALMMSMFRGAVRAYTEKGKAKKDVAKIISKLNKLACRECRSGEFISLFYAVIDVRDMTITYCNSGHEPAILLREGKVIELERGGLVLGVDCDWQYEIQTVNLVDGDTLLFYTDGLIDAANFSGEFWGRERLLRAIDKCQGGSSAQMIRNILGYRRRFAGLARQFDDTSFVVAKVDRRAEPVFI